MIFEKIINNRMNNLTHVKRFSGQFLSKSESVSDHIWEMISMALILVPDLNENYKDQNDQIDLKTVIFKISVHDLDECLSFDIPRPYKYNNEKIIEAVRYTNNKLMNEFFNKSLANEIDTAKDVSSREGYLVSLFDGMQAGLKMRRELLIGNQFIKSEIPNIIEIFKEKLNEIDSYGYDEVFIHYCKDLMIDFITELKSLIKWKEN